MSKIGIKESDTGLTAPSQWDLVSDKQMMQEEQPLQVLLLSFFQREYRQKFCICDARFLGIDCFHPLGCKMHKNNQSKHRGC